jgi:hypothetical protein
MMTGYWVSQAIHVAAKLGLADVLQDGPKSSEELARAVGADPRALYRLLRALASVGVFSETEERRFGLTPLAGYLQSGTPGSLRSYAIGLCESWFWRPWGDLLYSVQTGQPAFDHLYGMGSFEYFAQHPEAATVYNEIMTVVMGQLAPAVVTAYDFSPFHRIVDVGGGHGALLIAILQANPALHGVLFDLPHVAQSASQRLETVEISGRCEIANGDFFQGVPAGGEIYILCQILHDWDDSRAVAILKNVHQALPVKGKVLIVEQVLPRGNNPHPGKWADLTMLVRLGGRERTEDEFRSLLGQAGLAFSKVVPTKSAVCVIEGIRL